MTSSKSKPPKVEPTSVSGRIVKDERGNAVWECKTESGSFSRDVDTQRALKALQNDELSLEQGASADVPKAFNPYNRDVTSPTEKQPRRSLDDLRKLSEQIKQSKQWDGSKK